MNFYNEPAYILADPFGRLDSGVSSYIKNAKMVLSEGGTHAEVVAKQSGESLSAFRQRLATRVSDITKAGRKVIVEAPESEAATAGIPSSAAEIHIRLHCSRQLGASLQGSPVCKESVILEQGEIGRANIISAPSQSAVFASRTIFRLPQKVSCYPNPAPLWRAESLPNDQRGYALFVGRFHRLKGVHWVFELAQRLPDIPFLLAGPKSTGFPYRPIPANLQLTSVAPEKKRDLFAAARVVVIPSVYETASMVGIEALAADIPLVAWSHLGIAEYASAPSLILAEPFQLDAFAFAVKRAFMETRRQRQPSAISTNLNAMYLKGLRSALSGHSVDYMPLPLNVQAIENAFSKIRKFDEVSMLTSTPQIRWRQKLSKLRRDPVRFFRDSWIIKSATAPGKAIDTSVKSALTEKKSVSTVVENFGTKLFASIPLTGKITFGTPPEKPVGIITALLYPEDRKIEVKSLISELSNFQDFRYISPPLLQIGEFSPIHQSTAIEIINRIDLANKKRLSSVDNLIMLDPPPFLVEALRSSGSRPRTIVVLGSAESIASDRLHTDVLIVVGEEHPTAKTQGWRRKIVVRGHSELHLAIRKAIQEGAPKSVDMLLPLLGFEGDYRAELLALDVRYHQGIIKSSSHDVPSRATMEEICQELARSITALAVTESVYLRYRSLCDQIDDFSARTQFLSYSLNDGVLFDVRT